MSRNPKGRRSIFSKPKTKVVNFRVTEDEKTFIVGFQQFLRDRSSNRNLSLHSEATLFMSALQDLAKKNNYIP